MEQFDTQDDRRFRLEVRRFLDASLLDDIRRHVLTGLPIPRSVQDRWQRILLARGWAAPTWPLEYGGTGWSLRRQYLFEQERARAWAPPAITFNLEMVGPLFIRYGTPEQRDRFLAPCMSGEHHWCQGFSEPGAGSDLAALQCRAERRGDSYVINGSKIWQTAAFDSDMMFGLFRTAAGGRKQQGISVLVLPVTSPGLSISPITLIDGEEQVGLCTFDDVEVPAENLLGTEGEGWGIAKFLLTLERLGIAEVAQSRASLARLKALIAAEPAGGESLAQDPAFLADLAVVEAELDALDATEYRYLFDPSLNGTLGPEASILKIRGTAVRQRLTELLMRAAGPFAQGTSRDLPELAPDEGRRYASWASRQYFNFRKISIYGGSNEIQRNIAAKAVLGL